MPLYTYQCQKCECVQDAFRSIAEREKSPKCQCGGATKQIIVPPMIAPVLGGGDFPGYQCPITDQWVSSRNKRREIMREHGLIEKG